MFYDRSATQGTPPRYLLLFGDGSFNNLSRNTLVNSNYIPTYQKKYSLNILGSYVSDDYYALLDDSESDQTNASMELGVGRLPVQSKSEAAAIINKIKVYENLITTNNASSNCNTSSAASNDWKNYLTYVTDDADASWEKQFMTQCDQLGDTVNYNHPAFNIDKIYLDAYNQQSTPGGERYPEAEQDLKERIEKGTLIVNYIGHGGEVGWTGERLLDLNTIQNFSNLDRLSVFVTATCEFSRFDDPNRKSAGEYLLTNSGGGAIALLTTTRSVTAGGNFTINLALHDFLLEQSPQQLSIGEIYMETKNKIF